MHNKPWHDGEQGNRRNGGFQPGKTAVLLFGIRIMSERKIGFGRQVMSSVLVVLI